MESSEKSDIVAMEEDCISKDDCNQNDKTVDHEKETTELLISNSDTQMKVDSPSLDGSNSNGKFNSDEKLLQESKSVVSSNDYDVEKTKTPVSSNEHDNEDTISSIKSSDNSSNDMVATATAIRSDSLKENKLNSPPSPMASLSPLSTNSSNNLQNSLDDSKVSEDETAMKLLTSDSDQPKSQEQSTTITTSSSLSSSVILSNVESEMGDSTTDLELPKLPTDSCEKSNDVVSEVSSAVSDVKQNISSSSSTESSLNNNDLIAAEDVIAVSDAVSSDSSKSSGVELDSSEVDSKSIKATSVEAVSEESVSNQDNESEMEAQLSPCSNHDSEGLDLSRKRGEKSETEGDKSGDSMVFKDSNDNSVVSNLSDRDEQKNVTSTDEKIVPYNNQESQLEIKHGGRSDETNDNEPSNMETAELDDEEIGFPKSFHGFVTKGKYISVKGDFTLRSSDALVESPSLVAPFLLKEPDTFPEREQPLKSVTNNLFSSSIGEFLVGLGFSRVKERYHRDMVFIKNKLLKKEGKLEHLQEDLKIHQSGYAQSKMANEPYTFPKKQCSVCNYETESSIVLEGHMLAPHHTQKREYQCSYCTHSEREPRSVLIHMKICHNKVGHITPPPLLYECSNCMFECHSRPRFLNHYEKCFKYYNASVNQAPMKNFEFPCLTPKPITVAVVKSYEKSLSSFPVNIKPKRLNDAMDLCKQIGQVSGNTGIQGVQESPIMKQSKTARKSLKSNNMPARNSVGFAGMSGFSNPSFQPFGVMPAALFASSSLSFSPMLNSANQARYQGNNKGLVSTSFPHLPRLQGPYPVQMEDFVLSPNSPSTLVVCEICDGYIKDMEQLRTHMQLIHKIKIHPKVLSSRPPLNCQKCQSRFFTDQGLERHLLGAHGLVTSNMQELSHKNKDAGCCTICGRVFASKLVVHMSSTHKITLKPAHLSYKCTVCSATFNLYRLFENHVYLVHSNASKQLSECSSTPSNKRPASFSTWDKQQSSTKEKRMRTSAGRENGTA